MYDLIYVEDMFERSEELVKKIKREFSIAQVKSEYDDIHGERLTIKLEDTHKIDYLKFIIKEGLAPISFYIQMAIRMPETAKEIQNIMINLKEKKK